MTTDRVDYEPGDNIPRISPWFGFELTPDMGRALLRAVEHYDPWEDDPIEVVEIAIREELGLAHTLSYNIEANWPGSSGISTSFARAEKTWDTGFVNPSAWQFQHCEAEMRRLHELKNEPWHHDAMVDDSMIYEPRPWAMPYVLKLWDRNQPFYSFLASISECPPQAMISTHELNPDEARQLSKVAKELRSTIISSDEHEEMQVVIELAADREMPAEAILEFFANY
jgi:hypothetical protein